MRHEANSMKQTTPRSDEVWYVDLTPRGLVTSIPIIATFKEFFGSGTSNHMTSHKQWFSYVEKRMQPGVVATGDDTPHPIANV